MTKEKFMSELRKSLSGLPQNEIEEHISFYEEIILDHIEEGETEEEAVAGLGSVSEISSQILSEIPLTKLVKERIRPKHQLRAWEIILLVLGTPIWLPVTAVVIFLFLLIYALIWGIVALVYFIVLVVAVSSIGGGLAAILKYLTIGKFAGALFALGAASVIAGFAIILFYGCLRISKTGVKLTGKLALKIKTAVTGKETLNEDIE